MKENIFENARIYGDAEVSGNSDFITIGPAISSGHYTTAHRDTKIGVRVNVGCFSGSVDEFEKAILETHKEGSKARKQYLGFLSLIKLQFNLEQ